MDSVFWTRLRGRLRHAALALGPAEIEALATRANEVREQGELPVNEIHQRAPRRRRSRAARAPQA